MRQVKFHTHGEVATSSVDAFVWHIPPIIWLNLRNALASVAHSLTIFEVDPAIHSSFFWPVD